MKHATVVAKAVIANNAGEILLLKRHRKSHNRPLGWDFPGGKADDYEDITAAVIREIAEETGIRLSHQDMHLIWTIGTIEDNQLICRLFYVGRTQGSDVKISEEHEDFTWVPLDTAIEMHTYPKHRQVLELVRDRHILA